MPDQRPLPNLHPKEFNGAADPALLKLLAKLLAENAQLKTENGHLWGYIHTVAEITQQAQAKETTNGRFN